MQNIGSSPNTALNEQATALEQFRKQQEIALLQSVRTLGFNILLLRGELSLTTSTAIAEELMRYCKLLLDREEGHA